MTSSRLVAKISPSLLFPFLDWILLMEHFLQPFPCAPSAFRNCGLSQIDGKCKQVDGRACTLCLWSWVGGNQGRCIELSEIRRKNKENSKKIPFHHKKWETSFSPWTFKYLPFSWIPYNCALNDCSGLHLGHFPPQLHLLHSRRTPLLPNFVFSDNYVPRMCDGPSKRVACTHHSRMEENQFVCSPLWHNARPKQGTPSPSRFLPHEEKFWQRQIVESAKWMQIENESYREEERDGGEHRSLFASSAHTPTERRENAKYWGVFIVIYAMYFDINTCNSLVGSMHVDAAVFDWGGVISPSPFPLLVCERKKEKILTIDGRKRWCEGRKMYFVRTQCSLENLGSPVWASIPVLRASDQGGEIFHVLSIFFIVENIF